MKSTTKKKLVLIFLLVMTLLLAMSAVAEAGAWDKTKGSVKNAWSKTGKFIKSGQFWANAFILFIAAFLVYQVALKKKMGEDKTTLVILYALMVVIGLAFAVNITDASGQPVVFWKLTKARDATQFLFGPATPSADPQCKGPGAYMKSSVSALAPACRQAVLRINSGKGLPAFLVAAILIYIALALKKDWFGKDGGPATKYLPLAIGIFLGALFANEGYAKNTILIFGGWIALLFLAYPAMNAALQKGKEGREHKGLAFGLCFAIIQIVLNLLGTSLIGHMGGLFYPLDDVTALRMIVYLAIGAGIGVVYDTMVKGTGLLQKYFKGVSDRKKAEIDDHIQKGTFKDAMKAMWKSIPLLGWIGRKKAEDVKRKDMKLSEIKDNVEKKYWQHIYDGDVHSDDFRRLKKERQDAQDRTWHHNPYGYDPAMFEEQRQQSQPTQEPDDTQQ